MAAVGLAIGQSVAQAFEKAVGQSVETAVVLGLNFKRSVVV